MIVRLVLAAGAGRRLGRAKATARLGERTFLDRILASPMPADAVDLVVTGAHRDVTEAEAARWRTPCVHNVNWEVGQSSSLLCGLSALPEGCEGVLLHPVDFPLVRADDYRSLFRVWNEHADDPRRIAVVSHALRRGHPILFAASWVPVLRTTLAGGGTAREVFRGAGPAVRYAVVEHDGVLRDIDTPEDLAAAEETLRGRAREDD